METIVENIAEVLKQGIFGLFEFILYLIGFLIQMFLLPIDILLKSLFPSFSTYLVNFSNSLNLLITAPFNYFWNILPPITRFTLALWLTTMIAYYSVIWSYRAIIFIPKVYNRIKFW